VEDVSKEGKKAGNKTIGKENQYWKCKWGKETGS
jgi:hypothetical protein